MSEFDFDSSTDVFEAGVPYRFVLVNEGGLEHELVIVPRGESNEDNHIFEVEEDELPPGATVMREFTFPAAGEYDFACFVPGHFEGGMVLPIRVEAEP